MIALRRQPPVYSPVSVGAACRAAGHGLRLGTDARPRLSGRLRGHYGRSHAALFGSGTEALVLALLAARQAGIVALPAFTCFDVGSAAVAAGVRIALYDVDPVTLAPDLDSLSRVLAAGVRVVVVTPLFGIPVDWDAVERLLRAHDAVAIEDAAQCHGALWRGRPLGSFGTLGVLSFGRGKGWTGGGGGALLLDGTVAGMVMDDWTGLERDIVTEARVAVGALAQAVLGRPGIYGLPAALPWLHLGETIYRSAPTPGVMTRAAAALIDATWEVARREVAERQANARALSERLQGARGIAAIHPPVGGEAGYLRLPFRVPGGMAGFTDPAAALRLGIAPSYPSTLFALPEVRDRLVWSGRWPGADALARELITLPTHSLVSVAEREALARLIERGRN